MIKGMHAMLYTEQPEAMRAFLRDQLGFPFSDVGDGWLIFDTPEADIGCHPSTSRYHELSFYCDDIAKTMRELEARGVEFCHEVRDQGFGLVTHFKLPDGSEMQLYQPSYQKSGPD